MAANIIRNRWGGTNCIQEFNITLNTFSALLSSSFLTLILLLSFCISFIWNIVLLNHNFRSTWVRKELALQEHLSLVQRYHLKVHGNVGGYDGDGRDGEHHNVHHCLWAVSLQSQGYHQSSISLFTSLSARMVQLRVCLWSLRVEN